MAPISRSHCKNEKSWDEALKDYHEQLRDYLHYLMECDCIEKLLSTVEAEVKERFVPDDFKLRFTVRVLVRHVIEHIRNHISKPGTDVAAGICAYSDGGTRALERLVYLMRDTLEYSTRDTSLLIGCSDARIEELLLLARRRIDMYEGPSSVTVESSNEIYFRWMLSYCESRK